MELLLVKIASALVCVDVILMGLGNKLEPAVKQDVEEIRKRLREAKLYARDVQRRSSETKE